MTTLSGRTTARVLEFLYSLGWIGSLMYGMGLGSLDFQLMRTGHSDPFVISAKSILIGFAAQCFLNSVMIGVLGFMVWTFASMSLAAADCLEVGQDRKIARENEVRASAMRPHRSFRCEFCTFSMT